MNDLHTLLSQQHHGLRTFRTFQQKLDDVSKGDPEQRALCRLQNVIVGSYVDTFDEEPLPVEVADLAYRRLLDLVASVDFSASGMRLRLLIARWRRWCVPTRRWRARLR